MRRRYGAVIRGVPGVLALGMLASCQNPVPRYVPPQGGNTAEVRVRPALPPGTAFGLYAFDDAHGCRDPKRIATGSYKTGEQPVTVRSGPLATMEFVGVERTRACVVGFSFYPQARHTYVVETNQDSVGCSVHVLDTTNGSRQPERSFVRRVMRKNSCEPIDFTRAGGVIKESYGAGTVSDAARRPASIDDFKELLAK